MDWDDRFYCHEDVYLRPGMSAAYLPNMGRQRTKVDGMSNTLVGIFAQLRPMGERWPRAVNLWESTWKIKVGALNEQFMADAGPRPANDVQLTAWWVASAGQRSGGWDRLMRPGPGSPALKDLQKGPPRRAVVQQLVRLRLGAREDYLAWFAQEMPKALAGSAWQAMMWLAPLHGESVVAYFSAEDWSRVVELGRALPLPDAAWEPVVETSALKPWDGSDYLKRP